MKQRAPKNNFGENYYTNNNYASYLDRAERYEHMVAELHLDFFRKIGLNFKDADILDFGCAIGLLLNGLKKCGIGKHLLGYDVSTWAIEYGLNNFFAYDSASVCMTTEIKPVVTRAHDLTYALDVLEHLTDDELNYFLCETKTNYLVVRIPVCKKDNGKFVLSVSENDATHIQRKTKRSWDYLIRSAMFDFVTKINIAHVYDTDGVFCALYRSKNLTLF